MKKYYSLVFPLLMSSPLYANCDKAQDYYEQAHAKRKSHPEQALNSIEQAIRLCPKFYTYYEQGKILFKLQRLDKALESFKAARQRSVANSDFEAKALARMALVYFSQESLPQASFFIDQAYQINRQKSPAWILRLRKDIDLKTAQGIITVAEINSAVLTSRGAGAVATVSFNSMTFKLNSIELTSKGQSQVHELGKFLAIANQSVLLVGHTDKQGDAAYNMRLSKRRADAVMNILQRQNQPLAGRIKTEGKGESALKYSGDDASDHQLNRRVEMQLLSIGAEAY